MTEIPKDIMNKADRLESILTSLRREYGVTMIANALMEARDKALEDAEGAVLAVGYYSLGLTGDETEICDAQIAYSAKVIRAMKSTTR